MKPKPPSVILAEKIAAAQRTAREAVTKTAPSPPQKPDRTRGWRGFDFGKKLK